MELHEINRTLMIELNRYYTKNNQDAFWIFVDMDTMTIFNPGTDKAISNLTLLDLSNSEIRELHFGQKFLGYTFIDGATKVQLPYSSIVGYVINKSPALMPIACGLHPDVINNLYTTMRSKIADEEKRVPKQRGVVLSFPAFKH